MHKNITQVQLKNGMKVMLKEIHTAPIISSWIWYKVGSRDESTGKTGISHWTEHMMFKGTKKFPGGILDKAISREGGRWNASTSRDSTRYYETMPAAKIDLARAFGGALPADGVWLEVGFGAGEHLVWQAEHNPGIGLIGCEPFVNGVAKCLAHIERTGVGNVRLFTDDARFVMAALPPQSLSRVFVLFPDPWPKTRHHKRRFVQRPHLDVLARLLLLCRAQGDEGATRRYGEALLAQKPLTLDGGRQTARFALTLGSAD